MYLPRESVKRNSPQQYLPPARKHARFVSVLKPGNNPSPLSSYRRISILGSPFEEIQHTKTERVNRNFDQKKLTDTVFLNAAKIFDTDGPKVSFRRLLSYSSRLTFRNHTVMSSLRCVPLPFRSATSTCWSMGAGVDQDELVSPLLISLHSNVTPTSSYHSMWMARLLYLVL
jgi:hypothetical protein